MHGDITDSYTYMLKGFRILQIRILLDSAAQLVRGLHRNRRAAGSIPATGHIVAFFTAAPG